MSLVVLVVLPVLVWCTTDDSTAAAPARYGFYRKITWGQEVSGTRRAFSGITGNLTDFAAACLLLSKNLSPRCSAAVVAPRWAVTTAHCTYLGGAGAFLQYNAQRASTEEGDITRVLHMYRHPKYEVIEERNVGTGLGVVSLLHDVGLLKVEKNMNLKSKLLVNSLLAMRMYKPTEMSEHELQVMGFGHATALRAAEELFSVKMRIVNCSSPHWYYCICGVPSRPGRAGGDSVCSADSGGPVLYRGVQVAVTSMGPLECASARAQAPAFATSVFTTLYPYADIINDTVYNTGNGIKMIQVVADAAGSHFSDTAIELEYGCISNFSSIGPLECALKAIARFV